MQKIKDSIRDLLKTQGYDIVKTGLPSKIYNGASKFPGLAFHPTPIANYYLPENNESDNIANHMRRGVFFEPLIIDVAREFIKKGTAVLDIGANFGQMSIEFARLAGPEGKVHSFEAQAKVFDILQKNIEANSIKNIEPHFAAVYNEHGKDLFFPDPDLAADGTYGIYGIDPNKKENGSWIKSLTIDSLKIDQPISFVKIDIQGSDLFALQGAVETIKKHKMPILFEFEEPLQEKFGTTFQDYVEFVDRIGYKFLRTVMRANYLIVPKG